MKRIAFAIGASALLLFACKNEQKPEATAGETSADSATALEKSETWTPVDSATMMKNMMEYGTPGPMHKLIASWNGTWKGETTMWDYEGAAPQKSTTTSVNTMIMGDKYQTSKYSGDMMGMPFEGMSLLAYDNATKKFTSTWVDTWSSGMMILTGDWDESTKTLSLSGKTPDIHRPGKECTIRETLKMIDDNTQRMEMYGPDSKTGKEVKMMEIVMKRSK